MDEQSQPSTQKRASASFEDDFFVESPPRKNEKQVSFFDQIRQKSRSVINQKRERLHVETGWEQRGLEVILENVEHAGTSPSPNEKPSQQAAKPSESKALDVENANIKQSQQSLGTVDDKTTSEQETSQPVSGILKMKEAMTPATVQTPGMSFLTLNKVLVASVKSRKSLLSRQSQIFKPKSVFLQAINAMHAITEMIKQMNKKPQETQTPKHDEGKPKVFSQETVDRLSISKAFQNLANYNATLNPAYRKTIQIQKKSVNFAPIQPVMAKKESTLTLETSKSNNLSLNTSVGQTSSLTAKFKTRRSLHLQSINPETNTIGELIVQIPFLQNLHTLNTPNLINITNKKLQEEPITVQILETILQHIDQYLKDLSLKNPNMVYIKENQNSIDKMLKQHEIKKTPSQRLIVKSLVRQSSQQVLETLQKSEEFPKEISSSSSESQKEGNKTKSQSSKTSSEKSLKPPKKQPKIEPKQKVKMLLSSMEILPKLIQGTPQVKFNDDVEKESKLLYAHDKQYLQTIKREFIDQIQQLNKIPIVNVNEKIKQEQIKLKEDKDKFKRDLIKKSLNNRAKTPEISTKLDSKLDKQYLIHTLRQKLDEKNKVKHDKIGQLISENSQNNSPHLKKTKMLKINRSKNSDYSKKSVVMTIQNINQGANSITNTQLMGGSQHQLFMKKENYSDLTYNIKSKVHQITDRQSQVIEKKRRQTIQANEIKWELPLTARVIPKKDFLHNNNKQMSKSSSQSSSPEIQQLQAHVHNQLQTLQVKKGKRRFTAKDNIQTKQNVRESIKPFKNTFMEQVQKMNNPTIQRNSINEVVNRSKMIQRKQTMSVENRNQRRAGGINLLGDSLIQKLSQNEPLLQKLNSSRFQEVKQLIDNAKDKKNPVTNLTSNMNSESISEAENEGSVKSSSSCQSNKNFTNPLAKQDHFNQHFQQKMLRKQIKIDQRKFFTLDEAQQLFQIRKEEIQQMNDKRLKYPDFYKNRPKSEQQFTTSIKQQINNRDKFVNFIIDSHYHDSVERGLLISEFNNRKMCLGNRQIGPNQLKKILSLISQKASNNDPAYKISYLDLSKNELGDQGVRILTKWLEKEQLSIIQEFKKPEEKQDETTLSSNSQSFGEGEIQNIDIENTDEQQSDQENQTRKSNSQQNAKSMQMFKSHGNSSISSLQLGLKFVEPPNQEEEKATKHTFIQVVEQGNKQSSTHSSYFNNDSKIRAAEELVYLNLSQVSAMPQSLFELCQVLHINSTLVFFDISNYNGFNRNYNLNANFVEKGIAPILRSRYCVLNTLNMFGCNIGNKGLKNLVSALQDNHSLLTLNIGNNQFQGMMASDLICKIIDTRDNLLELDISYNNIGNRGMQEILRTFNFKEDTNLVNLNFSHCGVDMILTNAQIKLYSRQNFPLKSFDFSGNQFKESLSSIMNKFKGQNQEQKLGCGAHHTRSKSKNSPKKVSQSSEDDSSQHDSDDNETRENKKKKKEEELKKKKQFVQKPKTFSEIEQSMSKLSMLILMKEQLTELSLNSCNIGDLGFQVIIKNLQKTPNCHNLTLNVRNNKISNDSINWIINEFLQPKDNDNIYRARSAISSSKIKLRLKSLNLSQNMLKTSAKISFEQYFTEQPDYVQVECYHDKFKFDQIVQDCPLKKLISLFYDQIFIETLDLSQNEQLGEDFAQFLFKYLQAYDYHMDQQFNFQKSSYSTSGKRDSVLTNKGDEPLILGDQKERQISGQITLNKQILGANSIKYKKNLILLNVNLQKCTIGEHSIQLIQSQLHKNKLFRMRQQTQLNVTEHFMLSQYAILFKDVEPKVQAGKFSLDNLRREYEKTKQYFEEKCEQLNEKHDQQRYVLRDLKYQQTELEKETRVIYKKAGLIDQRLCEQEMELEKIIKVKQDENNDIQQKITQTKEKIKHLKDTHKSKMKEELYHLQMMLKGNNQELERHKELEAEIEKETELYTKRLLDSKRKKQKQAQMKNSQINTTRQQTPTKKSPSSSKIQLKNSNTTLNTTQSQTKTVKLNLSTIREIKKRNQSTSKSRSRSKSKKKQQ